MIAYPEDHHGKLRKLADYGGKGANLLRLTDHGFAVPNFVVVPISLLAAELEALKPFIHHNLSRLATGNDDTLQQVSQAISHKIRRHRFSPAFEAALERVLRERFPAGVLFAVRSSAAVEDGTETSYAGMFDSYLFVRRQHLLDQVKACLASSFNVRVLTYKTLRQLDPFDYRMGVVVQEMIDSARAGVLFTMNAAGNLTESLICAAFGQGEGVVQGRSDTDTYCVDRTTGISNRVVPRPETGSGGHDGDSAAAAGGRVLSDAELHLLIERGLAVEQLFETPQDIEFAFDHAGALHLLQCRPITTIRPDEIRILDNSNIVESYPGITLPLTFSFAKSAYREVFTSAVRAAGASGSEIERLEPHLSEMIALVQGRVYYQLHNWYAILQGYFTTDRALTAWESSLGVSHFQQRTRRITPLAKLKNAVTVVRLFLRHKRSCDRFFRSFEADYREVRDFMVRARSEQLPATQLFAFYRQRTPQWFSNWGTTIVNDFFAFGAFGRLEKMVATYGVERQPNLAGDLLCGTEGVDSERVLLELLDLKEFIVRRPELRELIEGEPAAALALVRNRFPDFAARLDDYIDRNGDRTLEELKLESPNLRAQPELLIGLLRNYLASPSSAQHFRESQAGIRARAEATIARHQSPASPRTWLFNYLLGFTRETVKQRENMRFVRTRAFGQIRELFLEIGARMVQAGYLEQARDVFYLDVEALRSFCLGGARGNGKARVAQQKWLRRHNERLILPDRILFMEGRLPTFGDTSAPPMKRMRQLRGLAISSGEARGTALLLERPKLNRKIDGDILVTRMTDPGWIFLMAQAKGIVSEKGSALSHTAIIGRELGIPTIVGVAGATRLIETGDRLYLDGNTGLIELLDQTEAGHRAATNEE